MRRRIAHRLMWGVVVPLLRIIAALDPEHTSINITNTKGAP